MLYVARSVRKSLNSELSKYLWLIACLIDILTIYSENTAFQKTSRRSDDSMQKLDYDLFGH